MYNFVFDIDDTVYDQMIPFQKAFEKNFSQYSQLSLSELYRHNRYYSDEVFDLTVKGEMSIEKMHIYRISEAFRVMGIGISDAEALQFQQDYVAAQQELEPTPDMREALNYCRDHGLKFGVITNGPAQHQRKKVKQLGIYDWLDYDQVVVSGELEFMKPDVRIFRHTEKLLGIQAENTYYIGDSYANDIVGAKGAGWHTIWINRREGHIPADGVQPDLILNNDDSIATVIRKLCES